MISIPGYFHDFRSRLAAVTLAAMMCWTVPAFSQQQAEPEPPPPPRAPAASTYGGRIDQRRHRFFGNVSRASPR